MLGGCFGGHGAALRLPSQKLRRHTQLCCTTHPVSALHWRLTFHMLAESSAAYAAVSEPRVSQGPVGAQRREAQPAGEAEKQRSVPFSAHSELVKTKCLLFEWQLILDPRLCSRGL